MQAKKDYRISQVSFTPEELTGLKEDIYDYYNEGAQRKLAKIFNTTPANINIALAGGNMKMAAKLKSHMAKKRETQSAMVN